MGERQEETGGMGERESLQRDRGREKEEKERERSGE